jgi:hypothetical protein
MKLCSPTARQQKTLTRPLGYWDATVIVVEKVEFPGQFS